MNENSKRSLGSEMEIYPTSARVKPSAAASAVKREAVKRFSSDSRRGADRALTCTRCDRPEQTMRVI
ncbi:hypothetical protein EVAR_100663_1 [Eumeta japonica]|uniref:Uncharacterized protein n=1 Tax=Eumeta variegata TaxID=151549 RepID=A0A4C1ZI50_EUMVA|nr:hypothetical protein EVAR_100663_1 [Eumeta japonica]